ncbi:MAG: hypothetical protein A2046_10680 [Bacteroidetes bacterium GWA2_30_7]|nr:MAG: hypothetical protein A2046_10680 [Bacteroidetes bacterium GWA2_30_7]
MGYLKNNNETNHNLSVEYNLYKPFWKLLNMYNTFYINYSTLYNLKDFSSFSLNLNTKGVFKNYLFSFFEFSYAPYGVIDYYEPHVEGRFYKMPEHIYFNFMLSPDYRKNFLIDFNGGGSKVFHDIERFSVWCGLSPRIRFNNKFLLVLGSNLSFSNNGKGFYDKSEQNEITFGNRTVTTITNTISTSYIFNKKSSLNLRGRHYWSKAEYTQEYTLLNNGNLATNYLQYNRLKDVSFNAFTIDMSYTWNFAPGSEISIVWKNSILKSENGEITSNYFDNFYNTIYSSQLNSFSLKVLYYVDYELLFR